MDVSLDSYHVFYQVATSLSFSKAAEKLFVTQPAVSQSIRQLEKHFGCPLFVRNTKKVSLTIDGKLLLDYLEPAFQLIQRGEQALATRQNPEQGELFIASTDTICKYHLLPKIQQLNKQYPKLTINIINGTSPACIKLLENASIDFAIVNLPEGINESKYQVEKTYEFRDVFVANPKYIELQNRPISLEELSTYPLLVLDKKTVTRHYFDQLFQSQKIEVAPKIELQSVDLLLEMAKAGLGIAFVPDLCLTGSKRLFELTMEQSLPIRKYGLIADKKIPLTPLGEIFTSIF